MLPKESFDEPVCDTETDKQGGVTELGSYRYVTEE
jgi:hypothetical protein